jgi:hypothetical protein
MHPLIAAMLMDAQRAELNRRLHASRLEAITPPHERQRIRGRRHSRS